MNFFKALLAAALFALAPASSATRQTPTAPGGQRNRPPVVKLKAPGRVIIAADCREGERLNPTCTEIEPVFAVSGAASDPDGDTLKFNFSTTGGRLSGSGQNITLDMRGVAPGAYTITVEVDDGRGGTVNDSVTINVEQCSCPAQAFIPLPCPTVDVSCPSDPLKPGAPITFKARVMGGGPNVTPTYDWAVSAGTVTRGQGTSEITVDTTGLPSSASVTATVDVGGYDRSCLTSDSCSLPPYCPVMARKLDEYGVIFLGDEKARLDYVYEEMRNDPTAQMYVICYGGRRSRAGEAERRCYRAREYLVPTRGIDASRVVLVDGGLREVPATEFWLVPQGAAPPQATPTVEPRPASPSSRPPAPRRRRGRR